MNESSSRTVSRFENALLELVGKKKPDAGEIFDATSFATAKKTHCKSTEYDEERGNVRDTYINFPPKFKVVDLEFESSDNEEKNAVRTAKVTKAISSASKNVYVLQNVVTAYYLSIYLDNLYSTTSS